MKVTARQVKGRVGVVELLVDGKVVDGVRCIPGSARVSGGQVEFTATVQAEPHRQEAQEAARGGAKAESRTEEEKA